ncbi:hypothetical protein D9619_012776 [Psilocybe cf. subviscida]|uniref:LysM domain-containing protein n=1 Tax=Psilocybe cf. subviscida TaxID=2480587 RepID=A0A8H5AS48_9AGAR|nr:hypothetical protein D9619_012776 [Psilocybe cf. subviscida]
MFAYNALFAVAACAFATQVQVSAQTTPVCNRSYTVQPGDFCDGISAAQNVSTYQLANVNPVINPMCTNLFVGQTLCLGLVGQDCDEVHVVAAGDGCWSIANDAAISLADLFANNPNINAPNCTNIYGGEVLCIAPRS